MTQYFEDIWGRDPLAAPMDVTYRNWLAGNVFQPAGTSPMAAAMMQRQLPYAALQYQSAPAIRPGYQSAGYTPAAQEVPNWGVNPFQEWLGVGAGTPYERTGTQEGMTYRPLTSQGWMDRVGAVESALRETGAVTPLTEAQLRIQERFGAGGMADPETISQRQRQLVEAPIMTGTAAALRGETQAILDRLHDRWLMDQQGAAMPESYMTGRENLWGRFGMGPQVG